MLVVVDHFRSSLLSRRDDLGPISLEQEGTSCGDNIWVMVAKLHLQAWLGKL